MIRKHYKSYLKSKKHVSPGRHRIQVGRQPFRVRIRKCPRCGKPYREIRKYPGKITAKSSQARKKAF